jgi:hypothetical protein
LAKLGHFFKGFCMKLGVASSTQLVAGHRFHCAKLEQIRSLFSPVQMLLKNNKPDLRIKSGLLILYMD